MTYNISASCVRRHERVLISLLNGKNVIVRPPLGTTVHIYAYQLREALKSAHMLKLEPYNKLDYSFGPRPSEGVVVCKPSASSSGPTIVAEFDSDSVFPSESDEFEVVSAITSNPRDEYIFPGFVGDMDSIRAFADGSQMTIDSEEPLTLRRI